MNNKISKKQGMLLAMAAGIILTGCGTAPKPLYQWEGYQPQVYEYFKGQDKGTQEQVTELEKGLQLMKAKGNNPPPGYHAHLALLYARLGKDDQVVQELKTEETLYPESAAYMSFLLKKYQK